MRERADRPVRDFMIPIKATIDYDDHIMKAIYEMVDQNTSLLPVLKDGEHRRRGAFRGRPGRDRLDHQVPDGRARALCGIDAAMAITGPEPTDVRRRPTGCAVLRATWRWW